MSLFEQAHAILPSARTFRGMGLASYQARKYVPAVGYLRAALSDTRKPLTPRFRQEAEAALRSSLGFVATFALHVKPEGAALSVNANGLTRSPNAVVSPSVASGAAMFATIALK